MTPTHLLNLGYPNRRLVAIADAATALRGRAIFREADFNRNQIRPAPASNRHSRIRDPWIHLFKVLFQFFRPNTELPPWRHEGLRNLHRSANPPNQSKVIVRRKPGASPVRLPFMLNQMQIRHEIEHARRIAQTRLLPAIFRIPASGVLRPQPVHDETKMPAALRIVRLTVAELRRPRKIQQIVIERPCRYRAGPCPRWRRCLRTLRSRTSGRRRRWQCAGSANQQTQKRDRQNLHIVVI